MQASLAEALEDLHTRIANMVLELDERALQWQPAPGTRSIYDLIITAATEERRWIAEGVAIAPPSAGDICDSPNSSPLSDHPLYHLGCAGQVSQTILASLAPAEWADERQVAGQTVTVAGCVLHTLEELARALGQIEVVAQMWKAGQP